MDGQADRRTDNLNELTVASSQQEETPVFFRKLMETAPEVLDIP